MEAICNTRIIGRWTNIVLCIVAGIALCGNAVAAPIHQNHGMTSCHETGECLAQAEKASEKSKKAKSKKEQSKKAKSKKEPSKKAKSKKEPSKKAKSKKEPSKKEKSKKEPSKKEKSKKEPSKKQKSEKSKKDKSKKPVDICDHPNVDCTNPPDPGTPPGGHGTVPQPATLWLMLAGLVVLYRLRRRVI